MFLQNYSFKTGTRSRNDTGKTNFKSQNNDNETGKFFRKSFSTGNEVQRRSFHATSPLSIPSPLCCTSKLLN